VHNHRAKESKEGGSSDTEREEIGAKGAKDTKRPIQTGASPNPEGRRTPAQQKEKVKEKTRRKNQPGARSTLESFRTNSKCRGKRRKGQKQRDIRREQKQWKSAHENAMVGGLRLYETGKTRKNSSTPKTGSKKEKAKRGPVRREKNHQPPNSQNSCQNARNG